MEVFFLLLLVILLISALASGFPVAFALPGSAIITIGLAALSGYLFENDVSAYFAHGDPNQWLNAAVTNFRGIYFEVERDTLIAIPLFVFMGIMLQRSKIAEDLLIAMAQLFGPVPGGLGIAVVFVGALLAATTGIVGATVIAMGLISLPVMLRNNYNVPLATGTISASGTLGQIIPPSIVLIILADQLSSATDRAGTLRKAEFKEATGSTAMPTEFDLTSTSAGEMFLGALLPGLVLVGLYMAYILIYALLKPKEAPPVPFEGGYDRAFFYRIFLALVPPLALIFIVLGSIVMGIATVNQAGAIGAVGAMVMAGYRLMEGKRHAFTPAILSVGSIIVIGLLLNSYDINIKAAKTTEDSLVIFAALVAVCVFLTSIAWTAWRTYKIDNTLHGVMIETAKTTSLVFIILLGAAMLTAAFRAFGGEDLVKHYLTGLPGGFITKFLVVMFVIFLLGFFLDFIEIAVVVVPIIAPILLADTTANVTGVWLGVMIGVNMQTSFLTPPFGFALFYLRGVAPASVRTIHMYKGVIPFILLQLVGLVIVGVFPSLVNYLPSKVSLTSETAPPPRNPRLQQCVEEMVFAEYDLRGDVLKQAIVKAKSLDLSYLPKKNSSALKDSFQSAEMTFSLVDKVRITEAAVTAYIPEYRPFHRDVRAIQQRTNRIKSDVKRLTEEIRRLDGVGDKALEQEIKILTAEQEELEKSIPGEWKSAREKYLKVAKAEKDARLKYRRNVDNAYEPIAEVLTVIAGTEALGALRDQIKSLGAVIATLPPEEAMEAIKVVEAALGEIKGSSPIKSKISKVRRALKDPNPDPAEAAQELAKGLATYETELTWRQKAAIELAAPLSAYNEAIRGTIGLRQQERLSDDQASIVASC
nr:TRAP transporter large permease subunit [Rhodospirillaceae bacterium]